MRLFFQKIWLPLYGRWALRKMQQERVFVYAGVHLNVPPGVFHPGLFFTTTMFIDFLQMVDLQGKMVLDVGTGSGLLALFAGKKGGIVTAIDINPLAVETCLNNARLNNLPIQVLESDLFDHLPENEPFDFLLVNPPYFAATPKDDAARAFFAGENLEYFEKFFRQLPAFIHHNTKTWMILSHDCDLEKIKQIGMNQGFYPDLVFEKTKWSKRVLILEYRQIS
jgi:release factor glutamine methyltransferase